MADLSADWQALLADEFKAPYMRQLEEFLRCECAEGRRWFPPREQLFASLEATTPGNVKIVILGQDPYHGEGQAHGLSFSVPQGRPVPPSLRNIYQALFNDLGFTPPSHGNLQYWADQGVLLLNTVLSVREGEAGSHRHRGWERFTDAIISALNTGPNPLVFMLWGKPAQAKAALVDRQRHCILTAPHPSPLSAHRGFIQCGHFSAANRFLLQHGRPLIDWRIPG